MSIIERAHLIIYRIRQRGLEVFLVNHDLDGDDWRLPEAERENAAEEEMIELDPVLKDGEMYQAYAVEGDWHDIPSLKSLIKQDVIEVTDKIIRELEKQGAFFIVKEALKKALPGQYVLLKQLREIILLVMNLQN